MRGIVVLQLIPWDQLSQLDPAIVTRELAAKGQEEVLKRQLMTMLTPVHVEKSGPLLGSNRTIFAHYSPTKVLKSIAPQWILPYSGPT